MSPSRIAWAGLGAGIILFSGCDGRDPAPDERVAAPASSPALSEAASAPATAAAGGKAQVARAGPCAHTGQWSLCTAEKRLSQAGFVPRAVEGEAPSRAGFSVQPAVYTLGRSRLELFIYPGEAAVQRDLRNIDTLTAVPPGTPSPWETAPLFVRSGNLVALFHASNPRQAERLMLALTAGAPQPGSPR